MTERFRKAYDSLIRAFFEGTLGKYTCVACACGNIIADALGDPVTPEKFKEILWYVESGYYNAESSSRATKASNLCRLAHHRWSKKRIYASSGFKALKLYEKEVNAAGYTGEEFAEIENAFENSTHILTSSYCKYTEQQILEDQYNGLVAVVDVLIKLDEAKEDPDELKKKFREHPKLQLV
jgi:hypothetical protein